MSNRLSTVCFVQCLSRLGFVKPSYFHALGLLCLRFVMFIQRLLCLVIIRLRFVLFNICLFRVCYCRYSLDTSFFYYTITNFEQNFQTLTLSCIAIHPTTAFHPSYFSLFDKQMAEKSKHIKYAGTFLATSHFINFEFWLQGTYQRTVKSPNLEH